MKLNELCSSIIVGINKFNDAKAENFVEASLLTGQSLNDNGFLHVNTDTTKTVFVDQDLIEKKKLKAGDIVFLAKGTNLRAAIVTPEQEQLNLFAPATCLVIKVNTSLVLPEFLTVFLMLDLEILGLWKHTHCAPLLNPYPYLYYLHFFCILQVLSNSMDLLLDQVIG